FFFFSSRRRHTRWPRDWSSDVCSSDLSRLREQRSAEELPELEARDNDPTHVLLLASLLGVVLADLCSRKRLAANLVASGQDLKRSEEASCRERGERWGGGGC